MSKTTEAHIGIDLGGTSIKYGAIDPDENTITYGRHPTESGTSADHILDNITSCIRTTMKETKEKGFHIGAIGIGSPGVIDINTGKVLGEADNLTGWNGLPLANMISNRTGLPVYIDNDANLMGLGEYRFGGVHSETGNLVFLTIGTGIGGAIFVEGDLYRGFRFAAGELGGQVMQYRGETGFWEDFASTSAMVESYRDLAGKEIQEAGKVNGKYVFDQYLKKEPRAIQVFEEHALLVGMGVASLVNIFNPEMIVIGGGISESGEKYFDLIRNAVVRFAMPACSTGVKVLPARLGNKAGFLGAAYYASTRAK